MHVKPLSFSLSSRKPSEKWWRKGDSPWRKTRASTHSTHTHTNTQSSALDCHWKQMSPHKNSTCITTGWILTHLIQTHTHTHTDDQQSSGLRSYSHPSLQWELKLKETPRCRLMKGFATTWCSMYILREKHISAHLQTELKWLLHPAPRLLEGRVKGRLSLSKPLSLRGRSRPQKYVWVMKCRRIPRPRCHSSACDCDRAGFSDHPALHVCSHHQFIWPEEHFFGGGWHCFLRIMSEATMRSDIHIFF